MQRRPLKTREKPWARSVARALVRWRVRPNSISILSILFAALAGVAFLVSRDALPMARLALLITAAAGIQLRLLCNMLDGMVAVEGRMASKVGDVFNEFPDRVADVVILATAGDAVMRFSFAPALGWCAAVFALLTAYVRVLGGSLKLEQDFRGPMAKPHRMATMTAASIVDGLAGLFGYRDYALTAALVLIIVGCLVTLFRRLRRMVIELESR